MQRRIIATTVLFALGVTAASAIPASAEPTTDAQASDLFFSEYIEGSSNNKALEIYNGTGADVDLAEYAIAQYSNGSADAGSTFALSGTVTTGDVFVFAHSSADPAILAEADQTTGSGLFNGDDALALVHGADTLDVIGQIGFDPGSQWGEGLTSTADNTLRRNEDLCAGDTDGSDAFDPAVEWQGYESNTFDGLGAHAATCDGTDPGDGGGDGNGDGDGDGGGEVATPALINAIQGAGETSPMLDQFVTIDGIVVGDYEGPQPALRGFYVQEQDADTDSDAATSEGIFVFNNGADQVSLGDQVSVTGTVGEYQGQTQLSSVTEVTVEASDQVVTPATVSLPFAAANSAEAYEGMLVTVPQTLYVTEMYLLGRFGELTISGDGRLDQPTAVAQPGAAANAIQAANDLNRIKVDDATQAQNPDPIVFGGGGDPLSAINPLRGGDTIDGLTGVMTYSWAGNSASGNAYRIRPVGDLSDTGLVPGGVVPNFESANPRPAGAPEVGGSLKFSSFNVLNYFLTLDANGSQCGPDGNKQGCRGANTTEELDRQRAKLVSALEKIDADVMGLMELENTTGVEPLADLTSALNDAIGEDAYSYVDTGVIGTDTIRVGMIYDTRAVAPTGDYAVLDSSVDPRFDDSRNRPSLAQSFEQLSNGETFTVVANHWKSKGSCPDSGADADQGDGAGCWNANRTDAAHAVVDWIASDPTGVDDSDVLLVGDLNSYAMEDPIEVLRDAGLTDLGAGDYSYVFDGQWGTLDYTFASASIVDQITEAAEYHLNSDESSALDYNTDFKTPAQVSNLYAPNEFRTSDHDPVVVGLNLASEEPVPTCAVDYTVHGRWPGGFISQVWITNLSDESINGWDLAWSFGNGEKITQLWSGQVNQSGADVTVSNLSWNSTIKPGQRITFGFLGSQTAGIGELSSVELNGAACAVN
ncbi:ExeM/NucH family extracellular endonuclease [Demequina oxidasica]|uniref:ExeM/NucH family extracellular endonuclease n=1 Tax=Demequina oxidasica TaxID=676199 RepID=UPI0009FE1537|nr:ExeM/NucH family extracellular endonuclease [Demequina oxidasica]